MDGLWGGDAPVPNLKCECDGYIGYTYNQGLLLGALIALEEIDPDQGYCERSQKLAEAGICQLVDRCGILVEACEVSGPPCNDDQLQFKGIFMRYLRDLMDNTKAYKAEYQTFIARNAYAICNNNKMENDGHIYFGPHWNGPLWSQANINPICHTYALEGIIAAI